MEKASLISQKSISLTDKLAKFKAFLQEILGASLKSTGSHSPSAQLIISANGVKLYFLIASPEAINKEQAPSFNLLAFAPVMVPLPLMLKTGLNLEIF